MGISAWMSDVCSSDLALALWTAFCLALQCGLLRAFPGFYAVVAAALAARVLLSVLAFSRRLLRTVLSLFRALSGTVSSYRDNDFSFGIVWNGNDELGDLVAAHNALGEIGRASCRERVCQYV